MQSEDRTKKIVTLIDKQIRGELNAIEKRELKIWISESESNRILFNQLIDPVYRQGELMEIRSFTSAQSAFANFMEKYGDRTRIADDVYIPPKPQVDANRNYESLKYAAVIIVLLTLSIGFYLYLKNRDELKNNITSARNNEIVVTIPSSNKVFFF